jgi:hypothetical protein
MHVVLRVLYVGVQAIDVDDWQKHSCVVKSSFAESDYPHGCFQKKTIGWFWDIVRSMSPIRQSTLLQFVTGSCCVPLQGFQVNLYILISSCRLFL